MSGEYKWKDLSLAAEYSEMQFKLNYDEPALGPAMAAFGLSIPGRVAVQGCYASAAYRFTNWLEPGDVLQ